MHSSIPDGRPPVALVVEDEWLLRWALVQRLAGAGYTVREAGTVREALVSLDSESAPAQVVLLDLRLPDADGFSVLEHVQRTRPGCPVIVMTAEGTIENEEAAFRAGAFGFVVKPFDHAALLVVVADAVRRSGP